MTAVRLLSREPDRAEHLAWRPLDAHLSTAIQEQLPFEEDRHRPTPRRRGPYGRQPTATAELPPAPGFAARVTVAAVEVAQGARPATQLMRHCSPAVFDGLVRRQAHRAGRLGACHPVFVRRVRACHIADGIVEAAVIVSVNARVRAIALRLEGVDGRWVITALEMG